MATPSSSATSPSPPMAYLSHAQMQPPSPTASAVDPQEREQRKKAVQKFLARAEISMVTRALRTRLSYASYKAVNNISHVPLRDLEAQSQPQAQSQAASFSRTIAAKRKAAGSVHYYPNPSPQPPNAHAHSTATHRRGGSGAMAPPPVSSPRTPHPSHGSSSAAAASEQASSSRTPSHAPSLYASLLAPPPAKQARTIHNAADPPVPAPSRPAPSPRVRAAKASPRTTADGHGTRHGKARQSKTVTSPDRRKKQRVFQDKGKQKEPQRAMDVDVDGDVDMKAAATLTSLLLHHRPSIAGSASSPRSSIDGSDTGSQYSYSFAQSSARTSGPVPTPTTKSTTPRLAPAHPTSAPPSQASTVAESSSAPMDTTPPPGALQGTPRAAPTDNEAADLMLFLATSPSPARASKDTRDLAAYRALGGGPEALRAKGRVLFSGQGGSGSPGPNGNPEPSVMAHGSHSRTPSALVRGVDGSFNSSISSIGGDMGGRRSEPSTPRPMSASTGVSHLLPPPPMTLLPSAPASPARKEPASTNSPKHHYAQALPPPAPGGDFNFSEYINASPSPARGTVGQGYKPNHGLRADVGRKLFEEEQMRQAMNAAGASAGHSQPKRPQPYPQDDRGLGAGIDLHP